MTDAAPVFIMDTDPPGSDPDYQSEVIVMDQIKTGALIRQFRTAMGLTQKQLAERIGVSDKAVSKWERGRGCPDVELLAELAALFGTDMQVLLSGEIKTRESETGNMKKLIFYVCEACGNIVTSTSEATVTCCGSRLTARKPRRAEEREKLKIEDLGGEWYITSDHPMTKEHYITFVAHVNDSAVVLCKQYPEWNLQATLPRYRAGKLVWYCTKCGLLWQPMMEKRGKD